MPKKSYLLFIFIVILSMFAAGASQAASPSAPLLEELPVEVLYALDTAADNWDDALFVQDGVLKLLRTDLGAKRIGTEYK